MEEWKGQNTLHPDCSDKSAAPWGFDDFGYGTVGMAILDWILNVWDEICCPLEDLNNLVISEFNFYINDERIAKHLAESWLEEYQTLLPIILGGDLIGYENAVKEWLQKKLGEVA